MSMDFSRRQSLKVLLGTGLLSVAPIAGAFPKLSKHAFVFTAPGSIGDSFERSLNESIASLEISTINIDRDHYESILSIANLPKGVLLIGLVSEAEKVLIDAVVQDRRGSMQTTARVSTTISASRLSELAEMTSHAAMNKSQGKSFEKAQDVGITSSSLISFYAYL